MKCTPFVLGGQVGWVCGSRRPRRKKCKPCDTPGSAIYQCDWKLTGPKKGQTCDADLCSGCATLVGPEKHLCPAHLRMWERQPNNPKNQASTP